MIKMKLGDVFEINTNRGKAYFQCVNVDKVKGDLINVFNKLYDERPASIVRVTKVKEHYYIRFPLHAASKQQLVEKVGNIPLPNNFKLPEKMRDKLIVKGEFLGWHIIDVNTLKRQFVEELSVEQKQLSPIGIYNDTLLKEMLENGWSLKNW